MKIHSEEFTLDFKQYEELSYKDINKPYVELFHNHVFVGFLEVWTDDGDDDEDEAREYILINYEMVYLDTLRKRD